MKRRISEREFRNSIAKPGKSMLSYFRHLWATYRFDRRWKRIYDQATRIDGVGNLHLSICPEELRPPLVSAVKRVWCCTPIDTQESLMFAWTNLQRHWDRRQTGIPLHLPICGVFRTSLDFAADRGAFAGRASRATKWNEFSDTGPGLMHLFANMYLPLWLGFGDISPESIEAEVARRIASHHLCVTDGIEAWTLLDGYHEATDKLVEQWGLPVD